MGPGPVPPPRRELVTPALVLLAAVAVLPLASRSPAASGGLSCARAVSLDGSLRCDGEAPETVADVCGAAHADALVPIHGGDAIDRVELCTRGRAAGLSRMAPADLAALAQPADLNGADAVELEGLPGIGPALAARVIAARPFRTVDDLADVRGIGPRTLDRLRSRLVVRPISAPTP